MRAQCGHTSARFRTAGPGRRQEAGSERWEAKSASGRLRNERLRPPTPEPALRRFTFARGTIRARGASAAAAAAALRGRGYGLRPPSPGRRARRPLVEPRDTRPRECARATAASSTAASPPAASEPRASGAREGECAIARTAQPRRPVRPGRSHRRRALFKVRERERERERAAEAEAAAAVTQRAACRNGARAHVREASPGESA